MKRLLVLLLAASAAPAMAQHHGHDMPKMEAPKAKPAAKPKATKPAAVKRKPAARQGVGRQAPARSGHAPPAPAPARPATGHAGHAGHAGHDMSGTPTPANPHAGHAAPAPANPHAGHVMGAAPAPADAHAGHEMPSTDMPQTGAQQAETHAGHAANPAEADASGKHPDHDMTTPKAPPAPPVAPPPPAASSGPAHAADAVYGAEAMEAARAEMRAMHGNVHASRVLLDQAEMRIRDGRDGWSLKGEAWTGGDIDRLRVKFEGEGDFGRSPERAEVQALWSHAVDPWFNLQGGLRLDLRPDPERAWLTLGVEGLAPYWVEVDAAVFLSNKGELTARAEAEHDIRLTQQLILQPRVEIDLSAQDVPRLGLGAGLATAEAGLRLRYQLKPEFAPYLGLGYERAFGDTAGYRRAVGERIGGWSLLLGIRGWF